MTQSLLRNRDASTVSAPARRGRRRSAAARAGIAAVAAATVVGLAGCTGAYSIADLWSVTYRVSVDGGANSTLSDISYLAAKERGTASVKTELASASTDAEGVWSVETTVTATEESGITVTLADGLTARCEVLLDGKRSIAEKTGQPGEPVTCSAATPKFGDE